MKIAKLVFLLLTLGIFGPVYAIPGMPSIAPSVVFTDAAGNESTDSYFSGSAPIKATFKLKEGKENEPYLVRYEEDTEYIFAESGVNHVVCYTVFTLGTDKIRYEADYWREARFTVTVYESKLEFPNAFSPKPGYQSIVEFKAIIINRWGQKLYEWNDPAGGWDGTFKGKDMKTGTYYCVVKARGADGRVFNIKKDVNLMRDYIETEH